MEYEKLAKEYRKKKLNDFRGSGVKRVDCYRDDIINIIQHRAPFLFLDSIDLVDPENLSILGRRKIDPADPVFKGHFPGYPVYPGVLLLEIMQQMSACLFHFFREAKLPSVRAIKINQAVFQYEVFPNDDLVIIAKELYSDDFITRIMAQANRGEDVCSVAIFDMYIKPGKK